MPGVLFVLTLPFPVFCGPADDLYRKGLRAQRQGREIEAYLLYSRARALDPANLNYARAAQRVRRGAAQLLAAAGEHRTALEMAPDSWEFQPFDSRDLDPAPLATISVNQPQAVPSEPERLDFLQHRTSFRFRGTLREAYSEVAAEFGIRVVFHGDFGRTTAIRADLSECDFLCATRALGEIGVSLVVPLDDDLLFVAENSSSTQAEFEPVALTTIPLDSALTPEEVSEVSQAIRQVLEIDQLQALPSGGLVMRGSVAKLNMARFLARNLLHPRGTAQIEFKMVTVSRSGQMHAGASLPSTFPVTNLSTFLGASPGSATGNRLIGLGAGKTVLGIAVGDASVIARLETGSAHAHSSLQLLAAHDTPAEFKVGERYPVATAQYSSAPGNTATGSVGDGSFIQPPPSISFEDLGLNLSVTPRIHSALDVTLDLDVNFRFLAGQAVNDIPVLANREFQSQVRLRRGEFAIVSGMVVYERQVPVGGLSGLGQIPWLGRLFRRNERRWRQSDLLILVEPRVVRLPPGELARVPGFLFGTELRAIPAL